MTRPAVVSAEEYLAMPTEAGMTETIGELVAWRGGRLWHVADARNCPELADLPDLVLLLPRSDGGVTVAILELKSRRRIVTPGQREVAALLARADRVVAGVVRPEPRGETEIAYDEVLRVLEEG